jgi:DNA-binding IscR family transcriptional regulator
MGIEDLIPLARLRRDGGYTLARPAEAIVIGDVMDALGGRILVGQAGVPPGSACPCRQL